MAAGQLTISYSSGSVSFDKFSGEDLPRAYLGQASLEFSALGAGYSTGPSKKQRKIWSIATYATKQQCIDLLAIFEAWDTERATGVDVAEVTVTDELFGSAVTASAFFTDTPVVSKLASGNNRDFLLTFALTET
jgi:hypothetical protein